LLLAFLSVAQVTFIYVGLYVYKKHAIGVKFMMLEDVLVFAEIIFGVLAAFCTARDVSSTSNNQS